MFTISTMSNNNEILDINIDFEKASYKWMKNKYKHSSGIYKYYCKYPKCSGYKMLYPKNDSNYKLNIYSDYCIKHNDKYSNNKIFKKQKIKKIKINSNINININIKNIEKTISEYNQLNEVNLDEVNLDEVNLDEVNLDTL
jgi:hypothetical protein